MDRRFSVLAIIGQFITQRQFN
jgi:hypothetical protein